MKIGIVISTNLTRFLALIQGKNLQQSLKKSAQMGYDGVELAVRDPALVDAVQLKKTIKSAGLEVPAIGTGQAFLEEGLSFTDCRKTVRNSAVARIKSHICFASGFKAGVIIGLIRGRGGAESRNVNDFLAESLVECADFALKKGVELFIEPLNRYETKIINTIDEGIDLIKKLKFRNIKLLADTFHMNIEESSIYGSMTRAEPYLGHVHFADSNRRPPGCGHLSFMDITGVLKSIGYNRFISMEMEPWPTPDEAARKSIAHVKSIMNQKNTERNTAT